MLNNNTKYELTLPEILTGLGHLQNLMKSCSQIRTLVLLSALVFAAHCAQAATYYWTNGNNANLNWSYAQNWLPNGPPGHADTAIFTSSNAFTAGGGLSTAGGGPNVLNMANFNNIVDTGFSGAIASLTYSNFGSFYNNTYLANGVTLNVTNTGGFVCGSTNVGTQYNELNTIAGTNATLNVSNPSAVFFVGLGTNASSGFLPTATLDMSALQTFNATVSQFMVGVAYANSTTINLPGGIVYLAATNTIKAGFQTTTEETLNVPWNYALIVGSTSANTGGDEWLYLGQSNYISADSIGVGMAKCINSLIQFNPVFSNPTATISGFSTGRVLDWSIGDGVAGGTTSVPVGKVDFSLGTVNAQVNTLIVGRASINTSGTGASTGTLTLGGGTFNVNNAYVGYEPTNLTAKTGVGTITLKSQSGTLVVNSNLYLADCLIAGDATGTLNITNGTVMASNIVAGAGTSTINVFGGTLIITNSAGTSTAGLSTLRLSNAVLTVSAAAGVPIVATNVTADYSATDTTTINVSTLPNITSYPAVITLIQSANGISLQNGVFNFALGTLPTGYHGQIIEGGNNVVELQVNSGPQVVSVWSGADIIPNHNTNWTDINNWSSASAPGASSLLIFNSSAAQASSALATPGGGPGSILPSKLNNIANGNFTAVSLTYTNTGGYENTSIAANDTVSLSSGSLTVGSPTVDFGNATGNVTITGTAGTLNARNIGGVFYVGLGSLSGLAQATLDMSGLETFVSSNANWLVGVGGYVAGSYYTVPQPSGIVYLAETNVIYAASSQTDSSDSSPVALEVGDADTLAGQSSTLYLGLSNAIYADNISTARQLASGGIFFNPAFTNANPAASIRGYSAGPVANWIIGDGAANTTTTLASSGTNDFTGGTVNALANALYVGKNSSGQNASGQVAGTLNFSSGTINVNNLNVSYNSAASDGNVYDTSMGTINVDGAGLLVVNTTLNLAYVGGNQAYGMTPYGALNITNGGSVWANVIVAGTNGGDSVISVNEGILIVSNTAGTSSAPLSSLDVTNAILDLFVGYSPALIAANAINAGGAANQINILALPSLETYPITFTLLQSASAMSQFNFVLGSIPSGYAGGLSESPDQTKVLLTIGSGPVAVESYVLWDGADSNNSLNWSDNLNWALPNAPGYNDNVLFNDSDNFAAGGGLSTVGGGTNAILSGNFNNIVDSGFSGTISSLTYSNFGSDYNNTYLADGVTLNVSGAAGFVCGSTNLSVGTATTGLTTIAGANATLNVNNAGAVFFVGLGTTGSSGTPVATLDMSALQTFNATVSQFMVGVAYASYLNENLPGGIVYLAANNTITAGYQTTTEETAPGNVANDGAFIVGSTVNNGGGADYLYLGQNNSIIADTICVGMQKCTHCLIQFNPVFSNPTADFSGFSASRVAVWDIGDGVANGATTTASATNDFSLGTVNAQVDLLHVGRAAASTGGTGATTGTLTMGSGTFDVNTAYVGDQPTANTSKTGTGTVNVTSPNGTLIVNENLYLAYCVNAGNATGTLNVIDGTVMANNIVAGPGVSVISISGGILIVSNSVGAASAPLTSLDVSNAILDLAVTYNTPAQVDATAINAGGASNQVNVISLPPIPTYPATFTLIESSGAISGYNFVLGSYPAGYTASLSESSDQTKVLLTVNSGPLGGVRPYVLWNGADSNSTINWSDGLNWQIPGAPGVNDNVIFNGTDNFTAGGGLSPVGGGRNALNMANFNNIVDSGFGGAISSLTYSNFGGDYNNTYLASGVALNITGSGGFVCGSSSLDFGTVNALTTIAGPSAALNVNNTSAIFFVGLGTGGSGSPEATLDMSALQTFNATVSQFLVGAAYASYVNQNRPGAILYLAATNTITAGYQTTTEETSTTDAADGAIVVGDSASNGGIADYLYLGQNNTISADTICVGMQKCANCLIQFNPIFANPTASFAGFSGSRVSVWDIGDGTFNSGSSGPSATNDFSLGSVNAMVDTLNVGRAAGVDLGSGASIGTLTLGGGTFNVNNAYVGYQPSTAIAGKTGLGTVNLKSSTGFLVVNDNLYLGNCTAAGAATGVLNITNGTVMASNVVAGNGSSTINVFGGELVISNAAGAPGAPLTTLAFSPSAAGNTSALLQIQAFASNIPAITVTTLAIDGKSSTTNVINLSAMPPISSYPVEIPLIQYTSLNEGSGTFNIGMGTFPASATHYTGFITNDTISNTIAVLVSSGPLPQPPAPPQFTAFSLSGTTLLLSGANGVPNGPYVVLTSTNLAQGWTPVVTNSFDANGNFNYSAAYSSSDQQRFYTIEQP
jgi:hypothetical protein